MAVNIKEKKPSLPVEMVEFICRFHISVSQLLVYLLKEINYGSKRFYTGLEIPGTTRYKCVVRYFVGNRTACRAKDYEGTLYFIELSRSTGYKSVFSKGNMGRLRRWRRGAYPCNFIPEKTTQ